RLKEKGTASFPFNRGWAMQPKHKPEECYTVAADGDEVTIHYTGSLESGAVFDSSRRPGRYPLPFVLGQGRVIQGWEQGIKGMCVGEKRKLIIPSHLGYGKQGLPPAIPGGATLIFETELVSIKPGSAGDNIEAKIVSLIRVLAIPMAACMVVYQLYKKYQREEQDKVAAKKESKEERKTKKKRN
ncbi:unnamed protein product, partial [Owenia fusiformis]